MFLWITFCKMQLKCSTHSKYLMWCSIKINKIPFALGTILVDHFLLQISIKYGPCSNVGSSAVFGPQGPTTCREALNIVKQFRWQMSAVSGFWSGSTNRENDVWVSLLEILPQQHDHQNTEKNEWRTRTSVTIGTQPLLFDWTSTNNLTVQGFQGNNFKCSNNLKEKNKTTPFTQNSKHCFHFVTLSMRNPGSSFLFSFFMGGG